MKQPLGYHFLRTAPLVMRARQAVPQSLLLIWQHLISPQILLISNVDFRMSRSCTCIAVDWSFHIMWRRFKIHISLILSKVLGRWDFFSRIDLGLLFRCTQASLVRWLELQSQEEARSWLVSLDTKSLINHINFVLPELSAIPFSSTLSCSTCILFLPWF